jgi:outer membrane immunogenic protein
MVSADTIAAVDADIKTAPVVDCGSVKGTACIAAIATLIGAPALAADMAVKAPPLAPPSVLAVYNWSGFYVGGNLGYSVGRNHANETITPPISNQDFTLGPAGLLGGAQIGFNWQAAPNWVFGVEADWQGTDQKDSVCITFCTGRALTVEQKLDWLATLRGRIGYASDGWLWYVTGGGAWARVTANDVLRFGPVQQSASIANDKGGWTVGAGVETALAGNWTAKAEWLYVDVGRTSNSFLFPALPAVETVNTEVRDHIIRAGLNYRFGGGVTAYAANTQGFAGRAAPAAAIHDWSGFYVGVNGGYGVGRNHGSEISTALPPTGTGVFSTQAFALGPLGALAGGQIGLNWQPAPNWVVGLEDDVQWTNQKDSVCLFEFCHVPTVPTVLVIEQELRWLATFRARIGYASDGWLWYMTGGGAIGEVNNNDTGTVVTSFPPFSVSFKHVQPGWTVGGGVETAIAGNWTAKFEYLYVDLGSTTDTFTTATTPAVTGSN